MAQLSLIALGAALVLALDRALDRKFGFAIAYAICAMMIAPYALHLFD